MQPLRTGSTTASEIGPTVRQERRRYPRQQVIWSGTMRTGDGTHLECAVLDLSAEGARVISSRPLLCCQRISFVTPRFEPIAAEVVWTEGSRAGLRFLEGMDRVLRVLSGKEGDIIFPARLPTLSASVTAAGQVQNLVAVFGRNEAPEPTTAVSPRPMGR